MPLRVLQLWKLAQAEWFTFMRVVNTNCPSVRTVGDAEV